VRFGLCVRLGVDLHVRLTEEGRRTHPAPTGGETQKWEGGMEDQVRRRGKHTQKRKSRKTTEDDTEENLERSWGWGGGGAGRGGGKRYEK